MVHRLSWTARAMTLLVCSGLTVGCAAVPGQRAGAGPTTCSPEKAARSPSPRNRAVPVSRPAAGATPLSRCSMPSWAVSCLTRQNRCATSIWTSVGRRLSFLVEMEAGETRAHAVSWGASGHEMSDVLPLHFAVNWKSVERVNRLGLPPRLLLRRSDDETIEVYDVELFYHGGAGAGDVTESHDAHCFVSWSPASAPRILLCALAPLADISLGSVGAAGYRRVRLRTGSSAMYDPQHRRYLPTLLE